MTPPKPRRTADVYLIRLRSLILMVRSFAVGAASCRDGLPVAAGCRS
jgi:hypothetical protein